MLRGGRWQGHMRHGSFITEVAYPIEMETPGFAKKAIPAFRDAVRGAEVVPSSARITVMRSPEGVEDWKIRRADEIVQGLGIATAGEPAPDEFSFSFGDLLQAHQSERLLCAIGGLSDARAHWEVPALREGPTPDLALIAAEVQMVALPR